MSKYDFSGWATRNNLECSDGRRIMHNAFLENDGQTVPLVWNHQHNSPDNVLGHALLENRDDGVYAYGKFNETEAGQTARKLVEHGDICSLSIFANQLKQQGPNVIHGVIREVSLVHAGANPGAYIENVVVHDAMDDESAVIYNGCALALYHSDTAEETKEESSKDETIGDVVETMTDKQKDAFYYMVGLLAEANEASEDEDDEDDEEIQNEEDDDDMKHNAFDEYGYAASEVGSANDALTHSQMSTIIKDAKRYGSLKESFLAHKAEYGIEDIDWLFPDYKNLNNPPEFIKRNMDWVDRLMGRVKHTPFSRTKSMFANITEYEARAKGYIKGHLKKDEVFTLLKRTTDPTTIYKKQKLDRDDTIDITDFDVVSWLKTEMRMMLDEEIARAILVGDGRNPADEDHIKEDHIRPIWTDEELYTIKVPMEITTASTSEEKAKLFIRSAIKARKDYQGSGNPILFTTEDLLTDMLLLTDSNGRDLYESVQKLSTKLRVSDIVTVPVMENLDRDEKGQTMTLAGIIVNPSDYNVGADKGGSISMFDDFDIDYNQMKYLIETRCSGALVVPYSAIALEYVLKEAITPVLTPATESTLDMEINNLQENIKVVDNVVSGTLKYVKSFPKFSNKPEEQSGHYLAMKFGSSSDGLSKVTVRIIGGIMKKPIELDSDRTFVLRVLSNRERLEVTYYKENYRTSETFDLFGLTFADAE